MKSYLQQSLVHVFFLSQLYFSGSFENWKFYRYSRALSETQLCRSRRHIGKVVPKSSFLIITLLCFLIKLDTIFLQFMLHTNLLFQPNDRTIRVFAKHYQRTIYADQEQKTFKYHFSKSFSKPACRLWWGWQCISGVIDIYFNTSRSHAIFCHSYVAKYHSSKSGKALL